MAPKGKAEYIIEDVAGCGRFQMTFYVAVVVIVNVSAAYGIMFMAFGNYNPGWRCLDNVTDSVSTNETEIVTFPRNVSIKEDDYVIGSCEDYWKCGDVEFDPDTSTIVTEWGLICDKSWIVSIIISIQMVGLLFGSYLGGQLSDRIGRKKTLCIGLVVCSVSQILSTFSVSWIMFTVFKFFLGMFAISNNCMVYLYLSEFMTRKWRAISMALPVWPLGAMVLACVAWLTTDWRKVEYVGFSITPTCLIPVIIWVPESLRLLEVMDKNTEFDKVSKKILKMNNKIEPSIEDSNFVKDRIVKKCTNKYNIIDLFQKGYREISACIIFLQFSHSLLFYAVTFGAKSLYGNLYENFLMINVISLPIALLGSLAIRVMYRRHFTAVSLSLCVLFSVVSIVILLYGDRSAKVFGSTVLICMAKETLEASWSGTFVFNAELYPTVVRGVALGLGNMAARVGGIVAPFLIPDDESVLYIFMIIMTALTLACCGVCLKLPETKGKVLKETFDDEDTTGVSMETVQV